jgi:hypothetical protein
MNQVEIPIVIQGIGAMRAELRELKGAIAEATDPEQMAELSARAGELKDKISDANDAANVFASGSKFEQVSNSLGGIKDSLMSLDFEEANQKAKVFSQVLGKINPAELGKSFKGLMGVIGTMGGAFVKLGATILANPLFLLVAVITAVVVAVGAFMNKLGLLQPILDGIKAAIGAVVDAFYAVTDAIGLTSHAEEEQAEKQKAHTEAQIANIDREIEAQERRKAQITNAYNLQDAQFKRDIELAKAEGKSTYELEKQRINASIAYKKRMIEENKVIFSQIKAKQTLLLASMDVVNGVAYGTQAQVDQLAKINANLTKNMEDNQQLNSQIKDSQNELKILDINEQKRIAEANKAQQKINEDNAKKVADNNKKIADNNKKKADNAKAERKQNVADLQTQYTEQLKLDAEGIKNRLALLADGTEKEKIMREQAFTDYKATYLEDKIKEEKAALEKEYSDKGYSIDKYEQKLAQLRLGAMSKLTAQELQVLADAETLKNNEIAAIDQRAAQQKIENDAKIAQLRLDAMAEGTTKEVLLQKQKYDKLREDAMKDITLTAEQRAELIAIYDQMDAEETNKRNEERKKQQEDLALSLADEKTIALAELQAKYLQDQELAKGNFELLAKLKEDYEKKVSDVENKAQQDRIDAQKKERDARLSLAKDIADGITDIAEGLTNDQKKLEKFNKAMALVQIGIDTGKAISSLVAASQANPANAVTAGAAGIAQYASGIIQIATNIAKAKKILTSGGSPTSGGGGGTSTSSANNVTQVVPQSAQLFGTSNTGNVFSAGGGSTATTTGGMTVTAVVSETQITHVQNKINKINKNAEL